jgi:uracil-DNA glycosylase family 4
MVEMQQLHQELRACRLCLEAGYTIAPGPVFHGRHDSRVLLIGQAPGVTEAEVKRPFNAGSGRRLFQWLAAAGWEEHDFRERHYMTAVTKCYPGKNGNGRGDRVPSEAEQELCRPFLEREIRLLAPRLIIPVGGLAIRLFYPPQRKLNEIIGTAAYFPPEMVANPLNFDLSQAQTFTAFDAGRPTSGRWVVPLPHPSGASLWPNEPENQALIDSALQLLHAVRVAWEL